MDNNQNPYTPDIDPVVEQPAAPVEEPRGKAITAMIFGIVSIAAFSLVGIVFAILAKKFSAPILAEFPNTASARFANVARITSTVGLIVSIIGTVVSFALGFLIGLAGALAGL